MVKISYELIDVKRDFHKKEIYYISEIGKGESRGGKYWRVSTVDINRGLLSELCIDLLTKTKEKKW